MEEEDRPKTPFIVIIPAVAAAAIFPGGEATVYTDGEQQYVTSKQVADIRFLVVPERHIIEKGGNRYEVVVSSTGYSEYLLRN